MQDKLHTFVRDSKGRFVSLSIKNSEVDETVCAKIHRLTPQTIVFTDVNSSDVTRRVKRSSVARASTGKLVYGQ